MFYWVLPVFTGSYLALVGFTGFHLALVGFRGFQWFLLGLTGFDCVGSRWAVGAHRLDEDVTEGVLFCFWFCYSPRPGCRRAASPGRSGNSGGGGGGGVGGGVGGVAVDPPPRRGSGLDPRHQPAHPQPDRQSGGPGGTLIETGCAIE